MWLLLIRARQAAPLSVLRTSAVHSHALALARQHAALARLENLLREAHDAQHTRAVGAQCVRMYGGMASSNLSHIQASSSLRR